MRWLHHTNKSADPDMSTSPRANHITNTINVSIPVSSASCVDKSMFKTKTIHILYKNRTNALTGKMSDGANALICVRACLYRVAILFL